MLEIRHISLNAASHVVEINTQCASKVADMDDLFS